MLKLVLSCFLEDITFERVVAILEVLVIGIAAYLAYKVGKKQNQINEKLLGLHFVPRVAITFNLAEEKIAILNNGTSAVHLLELKGVLYCDELPATIQPGMNWSASISPLLKNEEIKKGNFKQSLHTKLLADDGKKYILETVLYFHFEGDILKNVGLQNYPIKECIE